MSKLKRRPGLLVILVLLLVINLSSLKPKFYLLGWDNFSSYFNLKTNIFRTLFSTWREYRGLGVPSDSEVVDLPRQIFFFILSLSSFLSSSLKDTSSCFCAHSFEKTMLAGSFSFFGLISSLWHNTLNI